MAFVAIIAALAIAPASRGPVSLVAQTRMPLVKRADPTMGWSLDTARNALAGAAFALTVATAAPHATSASVQSFNPPSVAIAADDEELRPAQKRFLEQREAAPQETQFEKQVEGTFKAKDATEKGKFKYSTVVVGLLLISFAAPMAQFFYYVKEEDD
jgi:hypothetical protein